MELIIKVYLYTGDLPEDLLHQPGDLAIDTETMGLNLNRDRLCVLQLSFGDDKAHLVQFNQEFAAPNLKRLLSDPKRQKIFHFARFDLAAIEKYLGIELENIFCTKVASKLARTYTDSHGLKDLCRELLTINISKQQQTSYWGTEVLSRDQQEYAAGDVLYLHDLRDKLIPMLKKEDRLQIAEDIFAFLPKRAKLDLMGWEDLDIFAHS